MPDEAGLRITISADVREAILNLTDLTDATGELAVEGVGNLTAVQQALQAMRAAQAETGNTAELQTLNRAIKDLSTQASQLKKAGTEGFDELGNKLRDIQPAAGVANSGLSSLNLSSAQARVAFLDLGRAISGQGFNLRALASNFTLLGPAAGIAVGALVGFGYIIDELIKKQSNAEAATEGLNKTLSESGAGASGQVAQIDSLIAIVGDLSNSYTIRNRAFKELQDQYPNAFKNMSLEKTSLEDIAKATDKVTDAIFRQAQIKGLQEAISEQYKKIADASVQSGYEAATGFDKALAALQAFAGGTLNVGTYGIAATANGIKTQSETIDKSRVAIKLLEDELRNLTKISITNDDKGILGKAPTDELKKVVPILQEVQRIYDELSKPNKEPLFKLREASGIDNGGQSPEIKVIQAQIAEAEKQLKAAANSPALTSAYQDLIRALNAKLDATVNANLHIHTTFLADIDNKEVQKFHEDTGKQLTDVMKKLPPLKSDIRVDPNLVLQAKPIADLNKAIQKAVNDLPKEGLEGVGQALGAALAKGQDPIQAAGKAIESAIGSVLQQIGKALIEYGSFKTGLDAIFQGGIGIPGVAAIALGVAAEALGSLLKSSQSAYHAFATGGIVTGPTLGLIGEAGPEVIFPLDRLNSFIRSNTGNGPQQVTVKGVIRGRDLAIVQARDSKLQNLTS